MQIFLPQVIDLPINREPVEDSGVIPRYSEMKEIVEQMTVNIVKEQLNRSCKGSHNCFRKLLNTSC